MRSFTNAEDSGLRF